jgi:excinuclease UvrABC nuclease subunit
MAGVPKNPLQNCSVYRYYDAAGHLLYVGCSVSPARRYSIHKAIAPWFKQMQRMTVEMFDTVPAARIAEANAIRDEKPLHNVYVPDRKAIDKMKPPLHDYIMGSMW